MRFGAGWGQAPIRLLGPCLAVGFVAGLAAIAFYLSVRVMEWLFLEQVIGFHPYRPAGEAVLPWLPRTTNALRPWLLVVIPTLGGLACGVIVTWLAPEAEGHGTNNVIESYHHEQGRIRPIVPLVKIVASAITLGTGGSAGREGPIAQIGAGFGSFLADLLGRSSSERRLLVAAGMGGGIAAIFRSPLAGTLFAAEVMYRSAELESSVLVPAGIASVIAYSTFGAILGNQPLFATPTLTFTNPWELIPYLGLALWLTMLAALYNHSFLFTERLFHEWPIARPFKPALGAMLAGSIGLILYLMVGQHRAVLGVLGSGYGVLQQALVADRSVGMGILLAIALGKILTTSLTIGSGGSGGVFGPAVVIGGSAGAAFGLAAHALAPLLVQQPAAYAVLGMAGFFAAAAKTPFSSIIIVCELTGDYLLLLPALWVCLIAFLCSDQSTIYSAQILGRPRSPGSPSGYSMRVLRRIPVSQLAKHGADVTVLREDDPVDVALRELSQSPYSVLPVATVSGLFVGVVGLDEVHHAWKDASPEQVETVGRIARRSVGVLAPNDRLDHAVDLFVQEDLLVLPVVDPQTREFKGILRRFDVDRTYLSYLSHKSSTVRD